MFVPLLVVTAFTALVSAGSAVKKFQRDPHVVKVVTGTVGVPDRHLPTLGYIELAGAIGVILGLVVRPLGIAAAAGLCLYFLGAVISHVRIGDMKGAVLPVPPLVICVIALVLRIVVD